MAKRTTSVVVIVLLTGFVQAWAQSLTIPFHDNFDEDLRHEWRVTNGEPIIKNGRLGAAIDQLSIEIGDRTLRDCVIDLDYWLGNNVMVVFNNTLRYILDCCASYWQTFKDNSWREVARGEGGGGAGHLQIRVHGNTYKVFINGKEHLAITYGRPMTGPLGIMLGDKGVFIDNFQVTSSGQDVRQP